MTAALQPAGEPLWARIAADLALPSAAAGRPGDARSGLASRLWASLALWRGVAAGAVAAAATLAALMLVAPPRPDQPAFIAVLTTEAGRPGAVVHAYADGRVTLIPLDVAPIPQGRTLQVWTRPASATGPVAIGLMDQVRTIRLDLRNLSPAQLRQQFAVSLEPAGGSPTGTPTGPVMMQGDLAPAR
jgi:anti-sigma-K factor RskA